MSVKPTYNLRRDYPPVLRDLLVFAMTHGLGVRVMRDDDRGTVGNHIGVPMTLTMDRLTLRTADGGTTRMPLWEVERCVLLGEKGWVAA